MVDYLMAASSAVGCSVTDSVAPLINSVDVAALSPPDAEPGSCLLQKDHAIS